VDRRALALRATVFAVAGCGLVYELLASTVASWVLGDAVLQFSIIIGGYLSALGVGSLLSGSIRDQLAKRFVQIELVIAIVGGSAAPVLLAVSDSPLSFRSVLYGSTFACGTLVGLEIPLLVRLLEKREGFGDAVARVFAFDHVGSLAGSLLYAWLLAPRLGPARSACIVGMTSGFVALASTWVLRPWLANVAALRLASLAIVGTLAVALAYAGGRFA